MKAKIRSLYRAPAGKLLLAFDLSQAESWIVAYLSGGENMKFFLNHSDIHSESGVELFDKVPATRVENHQGHTWKSKGKGKFCTVCGIEVVETERYVGKQNNHANSYGMKARRQAQVINKQSDKPPYVVVSIPQCEVFQTKWHNLFPNIHGWHVDTEYELRQRHYLIDPYGFKRTFCGFIDDELLKQAYAAIPQSAVCHHFSGAIQRENPVRGGLKAIREDIINRYPGEMQIVNMSHDSAVIEIPEKLIPEVVPQIKEFMYRPMVIKGEEFRIPVDMELGENYGEMQPLEI